MLRSFFLKCIVNERVIVAPFVIWVPISQLIVTSGLLVHYSISAPLKWWRQRKKIKDALRTRRRDTWSAGEKRGKKDGNREKVRRGGECEE